jgi:cytoskeletal protein CcmA (bactofilin family)
VVDPARLHMSSVDFIRRPDAAMAYLTYHRPMSLHGRTIAIRGNIECVEDVLIEGRIDGHIWNENHAVTVGADAVVKGDIVARLITVRGEVEGTMMATGRVDIMNEARVTGRVVAPHFMLADGGTFSGKVEPQHLDTAMKVARHRRAEGREAGAVPAASPAATPASPAG